MVVSFSMDSTVDTEGLVKLKRLAAAIKRSDVACEAHKQLTFEYVEQSRTPGEPKREYTVTVIQQKTKLILGAGGMWLRGVSLVKKDCTVVVYHDMFVHLGDPKKVKLLGRIHADRRAPAGAHIARLNY